MGQVSRHSEEGVETTISFGCPQVKDPNDPWFGLMPGYSVPSEHLASGESTPLFTPTPVTQQVAQPVEQPVEVLERDEPFKGIEEQDLSPVRAAGPGPSRYTGTPSGIQSCTPTLVLGASLEELQLKEMLCDPANYPKDLPIVYEKLNTYCKLRWERRRITKADDKKITFRKEVTLMVSEGQDSIREMGSRIFANRK